MSKNLLSITVLASFMATSCATLVKGTTQQVNLSASNGQAVTVEVDGVTFQGPITMLLKKSAKEKVLTSNTPGCEKSTVVPRKVDSAFGGNIFFGGLLGSTTDAETGAMWRYHDQVVVKCGN